LKHSVPKSSALPDTGNFRRQKVFAFTLKGTSTDKMGKIKIPYGPHSCSFSLKHLNIYLSKSKTKKQSNKRTYSLGVLVFAPHCFETASKPISFNFLKSLKTCGEIGMNTV
jgi:hypothetical protein